MAHQKLLAEPDCDKLPDSLPRDRLEAGLGNKAFLGGLGCVEHFPL